MLIGMLLLRARVFFFFFSCQRYSGAINIKVHVNDMCAEHRKGPAILILCHSAATVCRGLVLHG